MEKIIYPPVFFTATIKGWENFLKPVSALFINGADEWRMLTHYDEIKFDRSEWLAERHNHGESRV